MISDELRLYLQVFLPLLMMGYGILSALWMMRVGVTSSNPTTIRSGQQQPGDYQVKLTQTGQKKINVIKEVRALTGLGLKEAKDLVERTPTFILRNVSEEDALRARNLLEKHGAAVEVIWPNMQKTPSEQFQVFLTDLGTAPREKLTHEILLLTGREPAEVQSLVNRTPSLILDAVDETTALHAVSRIEGLGGMTKILNQNDSLKTLFQVRITDVGTNKIAVIKAIQDLTGCGLKEAKDIVDFVPAVVLDEINKDVATHAKFQLEQAGAVVEVKNT